MHQKFDFVLTSKVGVSTIHLKHGFFHGVLLPIDFFLRICMIHLSSRIVLEFKINFQT